MSFVMMKRRDRGGAKAHDASSLLCSLWGVRAVMILCSLASFAFVYTSHKVNFSSSSLEHGKSTALMAVGSSHRMLFEKETVESEYQPRQTQLTGNPQNQMIPRRLLQWNRQEIDKVCPPSENSLRPKEGTDVPGRILQTREKGLSGLAASFEEDGVVGPFASSFMRDELVYVLKSIRDHNSAVEKAAKILGPHRASLHGVRDVLMSRCYAFDPLCAKLAKDPAVLDIVKQLIGDDIIVWEMTAFGKREGEIQPWHTDIEPYDQCYNSMIQIWIGVDQVTENSTLEVVTKSHRMPSITWMYPEHVKRAKTIPEKRSFEAKVMLPCATSIEPGARIVKPVTRDGDFLVMHSHAWHGAEVAGLSFRKGIRVSYATPDCPARATNFYEKPDIPPLRPIASRPPVLLVSGSAHSLPEDRNVTNNFLHWRDTEISMLNPKKEQQRYNSLTKRKTTTEVQIWNRDEIKAKTKTRLVGSIERRKAALLIGNSPLCDNLEITDVCMKPFEAAHTEFDAHIDGVIQYVSEGSLALHSRPNTTVLSPSEHRLGPVPELTEMSLGGVLFSDSYAAHNEVGGAHGGCVIILKFTVREELKASAAMGTDSPVALFQSPPLSASSKNGEVFFKRNNFAHLPKVKGFMCRCAHKPHTDDDHEVLFIVEHIPENVTLYSLPEKKVLHEGAVLFYPLHSTHGVEARYTSNGTVVPYRKQANFPDVPRCMVIELWAK